MDDLHHQTTTSCVMETKIARLDAGMVPLGDLAGMGKDSLFFASGCHAAPLVGCRTRQITSLRMKTTTWTCQGAWVHPHATQHH